VTYASRQATAPPSLWSPLRWQLPTDTEYLTIGTITRAAMGINYAPTGRPAWARLSVLTLLRGLHLLTDVVGQVDHRDGDTEILECSGGPRLGRWEEGDCGEWVAQAQDQAFLGLISESADTDPRSSK
jgi:hypothetical protein